VFSNHLLAILAQRENEEDLFARMAKVSVAKHVDALALAFNAASGQVTAERDQYRLMMYGDAALILGLLVFFFARRGRRTAAVAA
jgi:hypothetical protein